jgi:hypothetical protein
VIAELKAFDPAKLNRAGPDLARHVPRALEQAQELDRLYGDLPFGANDSWLVLSPMFGPQQSLRCWRRRRASAPSTTTRTT